MRFLMVMAACLGAPGAAFGHCIEPLLYSGTSDDPAEQDRTRVKTWAYTFSWGLEGKNDVLLFGEFYELRPADIFDQEDLEAFYGSLDGAIGWPQDADLWVSAFSIGYEDVIGFRGLRYFQGTIETIEATNTSMRISVSESQYQEVTTPPQLGTPLMVTAEVFNSGELLLVPTFGRCSIWPSDPDEAFFRAVIACIEENGCPVRPVGVFESLEPLPVPE